MNNPDIAIIINSFNRLELLKACLGVLSDWIPESEFRHRCVAIVYDAGSTDGSLQWLQQDALNLNLPIHLMIPKPGDDTSFAAGLNAGVAHALEKFPGITFLLFYETDNQVLGHEPLTLAIEQLQSRQGLAACGFTVKRHDGSMAGVGQPLPSLLNFALGRNMVSKFNLEAIPYHWEINKSGTAFSEVDVVYTSPLVVRIDAWKQSGGLDTNMFPFSDCDVDWAHRLRKLGWKMGVIRTDAVIHDNLDALSAWSKSRALQYHRGRLRYFRKHSPVAVFAVWPAVLIFRHMIEWLAVKLMVREPTRRTNLSRQFSGLIKSCINKYE